MTVLSEITEAEATGEIAEIYGEVRRAYAAPYVSSLLRHLATRPGLLEWIWQVVRPALASGALQHAGWSRVDVSGLPSLPPLSVFELAGLGVSRSDIEVVDTVCRTFTRVSPVNLVLAGCIARLVTGQLDLCASAPKPAERPLPAPLPELPGMVPWEECDAGLRATLAVFETDLAGEVFVPGLYRILARWPGYLARVADSLGPMLRDPAVCGECERIADRIVDAAPAILAGLEPPVSPPPLDEQGVTLVLDALATYRGTSPQMAGFGTLLLDALPQH